MNIHQQLEGNQNRRMASERRFLDNMDKMDARRDEAEQMIGQLMVEGKITYYVTRINGQQKYGTRRELIDFLVRNNYV
jgi:hypothetical protein